MPPGENLDLTSEDSSTGSPNSAPSGRRFVGVRFECCGIYARIYLNKAETAYEGRCPRCLKAVRLRIGPGGTDQRFFTAY